MFSMYGIFEFLVFGSWAFWGIVLVAVIASSYDWTFVSLVATLVIGAILANTYQIGPLGIVGIVVAYVVIGVLWSMFRYRMAIIDYVSSISKVDEYTSVSIVKPSSYTSRIVEWIVCWPVSVVGYLIKDILRFIKSIVTVHLKAVYENIYQSATKDIRAQKESFERAKNVVNS